MIPKTLMTPGEFAALPDDGMQHELRNGELFTIPPAKRTHTRCEVKMIRALGNFVEENGLGEVTSGDGGFRLNPRTIVAPDVGFVKKGRLQEEDDYYQGAPDLAVEIVSPTDRAADVKDKIELYLRAGAGAVWVVYPKKKEVRVHRPGLPVNTLGPGDTLEAPELLPGFRLAVRDVFA
ncbi:MAG: Uma2 family endonuclease [Acidobacteria bacterium]|nr:Uma2 family endonuclease [Acidobacteriota bacterium]